MNKIENSTQLRNEIIRLQSELEKKEQKLKSSFENVKDDFKPETFLLKAVSSATGINFAKGEFIKNGLWATISIVLSRFIFKQESALENKIVSWAETMIEKLREFRNKKEN